MKSKNILLIFNKDIMYKPIIYRIARDFDVIFNVLEAKIYPKHEGRIILQLQGAKHAIDDCIAYFREQKVVVEILADKISRIEERCVHCGACTGVCRVDALIVDRNTMEVMFIPERCVACGMCKAACPVQAMSGASIDLEK